MKDNRAEFTLAERLTVIGIILCLLGVGTQNVLNALQESEEQSVHAAAADYSTLRAAYAEMYRVPAQPDIPDNVPKR